MPEIKWKASELPNGTVVRLANSNRDPFFKFDDGEWVDMGTDHPDWIEVDKQDEFFKEFEIISVPKSWYEEFRVVPEQETYSVNRAGQTKHYKYQTAVETGMEFIYVGRLKHISIEEAIRRAFEIG